MENDSVRRIRRTRSPKAIEKSSEFDDYVLSDWVDEDLRTATKPITTNAINSIGRIASSITHRLYPVKDDMTWPNDFSSQAKKMKHEDSRDAFRVYLALNQALTTTLIGSLSDLQFKIMIFILNRTWFWKKPREGIPTSHFLKGTFVKGKRIQASIAKSPDHFRDACKSLEERQLIRITDAHCEYGRVNVYEIDVEKVISMAEQQQRTARKPR